MMLIFTMTFIVVQQKTFDIQNSHTTEQAKSLARLITTEVELASSVHDGYKKCFWLPEYLNGEEYEVQMLDNIEVIIDYKNKRHLAFLSNNVTGNLYKDDNIIIKNISGIFIEEDTTNFCP
ncbi:hypothetical protein ACFLTH_05620 [Bacteroidota bacterium]